MQLMDLDRYGVKISGQNVHFGFLLPELSDSNGTEVWVKIIKEEVQLIQGVEPREFKMSHSKDANGDLWSVDVEIKPDSGTPTDSWGQNGKYAYRYKVKTSTKEIDFINEPFAYGSGLGNLATFTLGKTDYIWSNTGNNYKVPVVNDLIIYELNIREMSVTIQGLIKQMNYLNDLGVNAIEIMPLTHAPEEVGWHYCTSSYFAPDHAMGESDDLKELVDIAHQNGIAVILDVAFAHASEEFPYWRIYDQLGYDFNNNPFFGPFAGSCNCCKDTSFSKKFVQDFFYTVCYNWLENYRVDGFRFDCVPSYYDGPIGQGYANQVYNVYQLVKSKQNTFDHWQRFFNNGEINVVLCAENLEKPVETLEKTYSNCTWQNGTLGAAFDAASAWKKPNAQEQANTFYGALQAFGLNLGLYGYPESATHGSDTIKKTGVQYINNHDHSHLICALSNQSGCNFSGCERKESGENNVYTIQSYIIGLLASKGAILWWQGSEMGANYYLPDTGYGRTEIFRPNAFSDVYTPFGKNLINLTRKLIKIRRRLPQLRQGEHFYYNTEADKSKYLYKNVIVFKRSLGNQFSVVALNFSDADIQVPFNDFPTSGYYKEEINGKNDLPNVIAGQEYNLTIPSNFGGIWTLQ